MAESAVEQPVVNVVAVGAEDRLAPDEAARDGDAGVEERHREGHQRRGHAQRGGRLLAPDGAEAAEDEADGQAAGVAEKDRCRVEVEVKKGEQRADERSGRQRQRRIVVNERGGKRGEGREQPDAGGKAVDAVNQIERVGAGDEPGDGERKAPPAIQIKPRDAKHVHASPVGHAGGRDLPGNLLPGPEPKEVVDEADGEDEARRRKKLQHLRQIHEAHAGERDKHERADGHQIRGGDGNAADARNRCFVDLPCARVIDHAVPVRHRAHQRRQGEAAQKRGAGEEENGVHIR